MHSSLATGLSIALASVILIAAAQKVRAPVAFEVTLVRLLPRFFWRQRLVDSRRLARCIVGSELLTAGLLVLAPAPWRPVVGLWTVTLFGILLLALATMSRRKVPCGCFGKSSKATSASELFRGTALLVMAACLAALWLGDLAAETDWLAAVLVAAAVVLVLIGPALFGRLGDGRPTEATQSMVHRSSTSSSRRTFLIRAGVIALALLAHSIGRPIDAARADPPMGGDCCDCEGEKILCDICCYNNTESSSCPGCCGICYTRCIQHNPCPEPSCFFNCWEHLPTPC